MLFVSPRSDGLGFRAAHEIDPAYAEALELAAIEGVEVYAWSVNIKPDKADFNQAEEWVNIY